jgi:DNA repair ATPase RecN
MGKLTTDYQRVLVQHKGSLEEHYSYPETLSVMETHLRELDAIEDKIIDEIYQRNERLRSIKQTKDRLTKASEALRGYLFPVEEERAALRRVSDL